MAFYTEEKKILDNDLMEERVKQIALNFFFSLYIRRDLESVLELVDKNVQFIGTKDSYRAHNCEELKNLLNREMGNIPANCVLKVISSGATTLRPDCYLVNGELELRIPYSDRIVYENMKFSMTILADEGNFYIASIHTALEGIEQHMDVHNDAKLHRLAVDVKQYNEYDVLTGLYTLDAFKKEAKKRLLSVSANEKYALLCTGVEYYERINNLYGLKAADRMLVEIADLLTTCSRTIKLCSRGVADHFILLVTYDEISRLKLLLKKVCDRFESTIAVQYADAAPKLGVGAYLISDVKENVGRMVDCANIARKSIRMQSGNRVVFYDSTVFKKMERVRYIEKSMKKALEDGEFKVYFQPKYDLVSGSVVGAEALCRWIRSDETVVYPDEFIPVFEKNGFIVKLDLYMLDETCHMIQRRMLKNKLCVPVSINQSRVLLGEDEYVEKIASVLAKYNTPSRFIELELTERIFKDNLSDIGRTMKRLKNLGIRWSIDDFGTGYSSLNLLKELPVDIIKIDKSFLDETEASETSKIIIRKTVELTQELNKKVVCEGVETESQAEYLRGICCDIAQGYLYAKPMPMQEFEELLDKEMK